MMVQESGAGVKTLSLPPDPQADMILRQIDLQRKLGKWDDKVKGLHYGKGNTYVLPNAILHNLDMAIQEYSEAWDMLEGGWKHHKTNPTPVDRTELLLELIDVYHFLINAYMYGGGSENPAIIASLAYSALNQGGTTPPLGEGLSFEMLWNSSRPTATQLSVLNALYGHGDGAHGEEWVKNTAMLVNFSRSRVFEFAIEMRRVLSDMSRSQRSPENFPPVAGHAYVRTMSPLVMCFQSVPDTTPEEFYSLFVHKNDINHARVAAKY